MPSRLPLRRWDKLVLGLLIVNAIGVLTAVALLFGFADKTWWGALLAFSPRWLLGLPLVFLAPASLFTRRWRLGLGLSAATALVVVLVYMDFMVRGLLASAPADEASRIRILQFNIMEADLNGPWLKKLIDEHDPDVIAMQECRPGENYQPPDGYHRSGGYSMCLLSKFPISNVREHDQTEAFARYGIAAATLFELETPTGPIDVQLTHLATVRNGVEGLLHERFDGIPTMQKNIELRDWESKETRAWASQAKNPLVVVGDFNLVRESAIFSTHWGDLNNAFSKCGFGFGNTKHTRKFGVRIDHVLYDDSFTCGRAEVFQMEESDHDPILVDLYLSPS